MIVMDALLLLILDYFSANVSYVQSLTLRKPHFLIHYSSLDSIIHLRWSKATHTHSSVSLHANITVMVSLAEEFDHCFPEYTFYYGIYYFSNTISRLSCTL